VNLVGNARDAMPEGGIISLKIRVESKAVPPVVSLEISDTGSGMTPDIQARIFQPFFTTKAHGKGTGLGLASVKHLVGHANGTIQVQSQPGLGSRFILRFPLLT
jgi:two-component system cell cycle sensor histidine kinase/response regulator CckA